MTQFKGFRWFYFSFFYFRMKPGMLLLTVQNWTN